MEVHLVLTDLGSDVKAKPVPGVSDHSAVLGSLAALVTEESPRTRVVFDFPDGLAERLLRLSGRDKVFTTARARVTFLS